MRWFEEWEVEGLDGELVRMLDEARTRAKVPFELTSSFRANDPRAHGRGTAVDVRCTKSYNRMKIVSGAILAGFRRIGVYDCHVHLDNDRKLPQDVMWWGVSK